MVDITEHSYSHRSNQAICDFADSLYPNMPKTESKNIKVTYHDGVYIVSNDKLDSYIKKYAPIVLRDSIRSNTMGYPAMNFGLAKGQSFDRVLIFPTHPMREYLEKGNPRKLKEKSRSKLYVAITRARYSVAFYYDGKTCFNEIKKV